MLIFNHIHLRQGMFKLNYTIIRLSKYYVQCYQKEVHKQEEKELPTLFPQGRFLKCQKKELAVLMWV